MKRLASFLVIIILSVSLLSSALAANTAIVTKPAGAKGSTVRMRQKPDGKVLANIPFGTEVEVLDNQGEWMKISFDGQTGWMMSEFLSLTNSESDLLSFDITGKWYEWYTVEDLITASERDEPANSRFGVDRFFTEDLLVPSDGKVRNIHQNADGKYIFDNWTDCEVCIIKNDELCILDGYGDDSVHLASLFLVDANTMWYYGSNEYVAVYKRTQPVHSSVRTPERPPQYDNIIGLYATALRDEEFEEHYSDSELNLLAIQDWSSYGGTLQYAVHDVNQDGYDELLIANESDGYFSIIDLYTINETTAVRLFGERSFGYRDNIDILEDGCLYTHGSSGADTISFAIYSFNSKGYLEELQAVNYSGDNMSEIEERKQRYDNMIIDIESAFEWTVLAAKKPDIFIPDDSISASDNTYTDYVIPEIHVSYSLIGTRLDRFRSSFINAVDYPHNSIASMCGMAPPTNEITSYAISSVYSDPNWYGFIDGELVYHLTYCLGTGYSIMSLFPLEVEIPTPYKDYVAVLFNGEWQDVPVYIWKLDNCYMVVRLTDDNSSIPYSVLYCSDASLLKYILPS